MELIATEIMGKPVWVWLIFMGVIFSIMAFDLGLFHRKAHVPTFKESFIQTIISIAIALGYGAWVWHSMGETAGMQYITGYVMELSLSVDNVFVISLVFSSLSIPAQYRHRVLIWGIIGVLILRAIFIAAGATLVANFHWILVVFGVFLLFTGVKMLLVKEEEKDIKDNPILKWMGKHMLITDELHGQRFFARLPHPTHPERKVTWLTPLMVALVLVNVVDIVFAVDSVPAIFAVTQDPYIVYTSNIFAVIGLRALYFTLEAMVHRFEYLSKSLALILAFIGGKIIYTEVTHNTFPIEISLSVVLTLIVSGIMISLIVTARKKH